MRTSRLEAFSDGVIAVIITIMVLDLRAPATNSISAVRALAPSFLVYALSFLLVAIMWINHHYFFVHARRATPGLIWSNMFLLFWMSLVPFDTAWLGRNPTSTLPIALYGVTLALCSSAFLLIQSALACQNREDETTLCFFGRIRIKALIGLALYLLAALLPAWWPYASLAIFALIPAAYFWPDPKSVPAETGEHLS